MVEPALDDRGHPRLRREWQAPAVPHHDPASRGRARDERRREVNAQDSRKTHSGKRSQPVAAPAEELEHLGIAGPCVRADDPKAPDEFSDFLSR
jgi:hypothetical protein